MILTDVQRFSRNICHRYDELTQHIITISKKYLEIHGYTAAAEAVESTCESWYFIRDNGILRINVEYYYDGDCSIEFPVEYLYSDDWESIERDIVQRKNEEYRKAQEARKSRLKDQRYKLYLELQEEFSDTLSHK